MWLASSLTLLLLFLGMNVGWGQLSITSTGTAFTQNFDAFGSSATATLPAGFRVNGNGAAPSWTTGTTTTTAAAGTSGTGALTGTSSGGTYNFANGVTASATDRALGFLTSGSFASPNSIILRFTNNTGVTVTNLNITFDYEKYRAGTRAWNLTFFHGSAVNPTTAATAGDQAYAVDGANAVVNPPTTISKTVSITGLSIANGTDYYIKWTSTGLAGNTNSQGIALDNFSITATAAASPIISSTGTLAAVNTTYGTASASPTSFNVSGADMTAGILVTPPAGYEVSLTSGSGYASTITVGAAGTIASTPVFVRLTAATVPGSYSGNIVLTSAGATAVNVPTVSSTVSAKALTVTGAVASNKVYNASNAAIITGSTLVGIVGSDVVTINGTGTFNNASVGTAKAVTSTQTLAGANASNYTLTLPTGLTADITSKSLTMTGVTANNKVFDGTTTATLSGTPALVGVETPDNGNVTVSGTPIANFSQSAAGTGIAVTVTGYTLSGSAAGNYSLTQPTGLTADITSSPSPVINSPLTATGTYGVAISTYTITATETPTSFNATGLPAGLTVNTTNGEITGTPTVVGTFNVNISATNSGGTGSATLVFTINPKALTVTGATADSKIYDRTNAATISGSTLVGVVGADVVTISNTGTFANVTVGTAIAVTSTQNLSGADAAKYTVTLPTGLSANITAKELTISGAIAQNKVFDGLTTATITGGTLVGIISPDVVTLTLSGTFASSAVGNGIAVTSTSTIGGAAAGNYSLTQPTGLTANITSGPTTLAVGDISILGFNSNAPDNFSFVTWVNINDNTYIKFTDNGFLSTGSATATNNGRGGENFVIWRNNTGNTIAAGTVVSIQALTTSIGVCTAGSASGLDAISGSGDQIFAYQGPAISGTNPDWTSNVNPTTFNGSIVYGLNFSSTWLPAGSPSPNESYLPSQLNVANGNIAITTANTTRGQFTGLRNNQPVMANYKAIVNNPANWTTATGAGIITLNTTAFTLGTTPVISTAGTLSSLTTTYGTPSSETTFSVSGVDMTAGVLVTPPAGFEVSLTSGSGYAATVTVGAAGTISPTPVYVRLAASATVAGSPYSGNIVLTSSGATTVNVATVSSTVTTAALTITGVSSTNKIYNASAIGSITGTASYSGLQNGESFSVSGTPVATFAQATVGTGIAVTVTGYTAPSTNYTVTQPTVSNADITPKGLSISGLTANNKVFDNTTTATLSGTAALVGVETADNGNVILGGTVVADFDNPNVGTGKPVTVTGYTLSGSAAGNYSLTQPIGLTADITSSPSPVISSSLTATGTYGVAISTYTITATETPTSFNATGLPAGLTVNVTNGEISGTPTAIGTFNTTISATNAGGTGSATLVFTINPKALTVTGATADSKIYDRTNAATISGSTLVGVVGADDVTISNTGIFASVTVGTAIAVTSTQTLSGADAAKYTVTLPTGLTANITAKALTISGAVAQNKVFDGNTTATITGGTLVGIISPDVVTLTLSGTFASSAIGSGIAVTSTSTIGGADAGNYSLTQPSGLSADITDAAIYSNVFTGASACPTNGNLPTMAANSTGTPLSRSTITCNATANVFNSTTLNTSASLSPTSYIEFSATANAGNVLNVNSLSFFRQASNSAPNQLEVRYSTDGFATFTTWGAAPNSPTSGTVATWDFADFTSPIAGTVTFRFYPYGTQRADLTGASSATGTFRLDDVTITGTVSAAAIPTISTTGTLSALTTVYGTASSETSFNISGANMTAGVLVTPPTGFEVSTISGSAFASSITVGGAGTISSTPVYVRLAASTAVGSYSGNIVLTSAGATTVNVATVTSTVTSAPVPVGNLTANNKVFDGTTTATLSGTPVLVGVLPGDVPNVTLGGTPVANFATSAIGTGIAVTVTGFTISGSAAGNYILVQPTGLTADITATPAPTITSSLTASAVYGTSAPLYTITASDSPTSFNATGLPAGLSVNTTNGEITGTPTVVGTFNVAISATNGAGTGNAILVYIINPKSLSVSGATAENKVYDGNTSATISGSTLVGLVGADVVTISTSGTFDNKNVGTGKVVTSTQTLSGADASKYVLTLPTGLSANITPKPLTIGAVGANNKVFDGNTTATLVGNLEGVVSPDVVTLTLSGTFATSAVGNGIAVTSTSTIGGADAGNYSLTQPVGLTANITSGPTVLAAGDIAVISHNTGGSPDNFTILVLKELTAGTVFFVNDNEVATAGTSTFTDLGEMEASFTVKAGQTIAAGTVINLPWGAAAVSTATYDWSSTSSAGLGANGDEIYIYTAPLITSTTATAFIYYSKIGTATGEIPAGLTLGSTSIAPATTPAFRYSTTGALYTGCRTALLDAIGNTSTNWNTTGATTIANNDWTFSIIPDCATISSTGTLSALSTTYGTASSETSFNVSGVGMTAGITVTPPAGYEVSLISGSGFAGSVVAGAAGTIASTPIYVRLAATATVAGSPYSGDIVLSSSGATNVNVATVASTVNPLTISTTGATASNKVYDGNTTASITGTTAVGAVNGDVLTIIGGGTFAQSTAGTGISVTPSLTVNGTNASSYTLTQPTGLSADITTFGLTITGLTADNKIFDGNTTATLSGTPSLVGVISPDVVNISGTYSANFDNPNIGTSKPVAVTGYSISGADAGNYSVSQPTGLTADITSSPSPVITSALTASGTYGEAISNYTITATENPTSFNATGLPAGLSVNTTTGEISGTPTVVGPFNVTISATNAGGTGNATLVFTIAPKTLTVTGAVAENKVYDRTNAAIISGSTLVGVVGTDVVTITNTGTFLTINAGTGISVTSNQTLGGADAAKYVLTLPTGLSANITPRPLTIGAVGANNKVFDGNTTATLVGNLEGVLSPDVVTLTLSGTFASSAPGNGIAVTSTSTIGGADAGNYSLTQPTGLTANITGNIIANWTYEPLVGTFTTPTPNIGAGTSAAIGMTVQTSPAGTATGINTATGCGAQVTGQTAWAFSSATPGANNETNGAQFSTSTVGYQNIFFTWEQRWSNTATNTVRLQYTLNGSAWQNFTMTGANTTFCLGSINVNGCFEANTTGDQFRRISVDLSSITGANNNPNFGVRVVAAHYQATGQFRTTSVPATVATAGTWRFDNVKFEGVSGTFPNIASTGTLSALTTIYGTASSETSFNVSGTNMTAGITVTPPIGYEVSLTSGSGFAGTVVAGAAGTIASTPIYVRLAASTTPGTYSGNIVLSSAGASPVNVATVSSTITPKQLTVTGAIASNKEYDATNAAIITGSTLNGLVGSDVVTINGTGTFASSNVGTAIVVTSTQTLSGANASNYTLSLPTGLSADITSKSLTIIGLTADNKVFDGNTVATLSGTPSLVGVILSDIPNVILGATYNAEFPTSAIGTGYLITVSDYEITGSASGNYTLIQPTGLTADITASPTPVINSSLTATGTYGVAIATYTITATNTPTSFNATGLPAGLSLNTTSGEISGTPEVVGTFNVTISATNTGGSGTATLVFTIAPKTLTVTGATAENKVYDRTNAATISGSTLVGIVGADVVTITNTGTFLTINAGTGIAVTSSQTLGGADAAKYVLTLPTGLTANITPKPLTIGAVGALNKVFDGNTTATLVGNLVGVISPDVVTLTLSGTFATSAIGNGIAVTSTSSIGGADVANYELTQPLGLTANILAVPAFTEVIFPQYIQGLNGTNNNRIPFAYRATVSNLNPSTTYRFYNSVELTTALPTATGAGNNIFAGATQGENFVYSTGPSLNTAGNHGTFTTDINGSYTGWFIIAPSGNATRFVPGTILNTRIILNDGNNGTSPATILKSNQTITVINTVSSAGANNGTGLWGASSATDKNFVFVYDNTSGSGRPLSGTFVENDGAAQTTSFATFYTTNVNGISGRYGVIVPNTNANGVQRIEQRDFATGSLVGCPATDADGVWPSGANTVNPTGGTTAIAITATDAPLDPSTTPTFNAVPAICAGESLSPLPTTSNNGITGTWSPALNNTTTTEYTFTPTAGQCSSNTATLTITVNPNVTPAFSTVAAICSGATLSDLPTTSNNGITGTWSPALNNTATTEYTFTPTAGQCATTTTLTITVNPNVTPAFSTVAAICSGATLSDLPTTSNNGITGTWSPALNNTATTEYTFTPTAGQCATTTTLTITVNPNVTPTFSAVAAICSGETLSDLPTTSNNSITGTWSPALNNTATTEYTFTPTAGQCATTTTLTITVNPNVTPAFSAVAAICSGETLSALPTTSNNSITGTWSPALNNTTTTEYTFTPTAGQCATTTTLTITVNPNVTPIFSAVAAICSGETLSALPTTSNNSITGTWSPALNNTATTEYTFTPTVGQCATTTTLTITVNPNVTPAFSAVAAICSGETFSALPTTSNNGITGTWSPALNNTATTEYTFTPTAGQCATTATLTITVNPLPTLSPATVAVGSTVTMTGSGTPNGTNPYISSNTAVATVTSGGVVTGLLAGTSTITYTNSNGCVTTALVTVNAGSSNATLNLTTYIQGYYDAGAGAMRPLLYDAGISTNPNACDTLTVQLHFPTSTLSSPNIAYSFKGVLLKDGTISCIFPSAAIGNNYYIVLKHRNSIQTWSANPVGITSSSAYNFSSGANQAYGGNQIEIVPGKFAIFSGDINQDFSVDLLDFSIWINDFDTFAFGYVSSDLNGDQSGDLLDFSFWVNGFDNFYFVSAP
jgi:mucin-19